MDKYDMFYIKWRAGNIESVMGVQVCLTNHGSWGVLWRWHAIVYVFIVAVLFSLTLCFQPSMVKKKRFKNCRQRWIKDCLLPRTWSLFQSETWYVNGHKFNWVWEVPVVAWEIDAPERKRISVLPHSQYITDIKMCFWTLCHPKSSSELVSPEWMNKLCVSSTAFAITQSSFRSFEVWEVPWRRSVYTALSWDSPNTESFVGWRPGATRSTWKGRSCQHFDCTTLGWCDLYGVKETLPLS